MSPFTGKPGAPESQPGNVVPGFNDGGDSYGDVQAPPPTIDGSGSSTITGTGDVQGPAATITASGTNSSLVTATGDIQGPAPVVNAGGRLGRASLASAAEIGIVWVEITLPRG